MCGCVRAYACGCTPANKQKNPIKKIFVQFRIIPKVSRKLDRALACVRAIRVRACMCGCVRAGVYVYTYARVCTRAIRFFFRNWLKTNEIANISILTCNLLQVRGGMFFKTLIRLKIALLPPPLAQTLFQDIEGGDINYTQGGIFFRVLLCIIPYR